MTYVRGSVIGSLRGSLRVAAVLATFGVWVSSASAGPGVIIAPRVEAFDAPSESASVVSELGHGAAVCVLDEENYTGVVHRRPGWLAIRLPGTSGAGYVRIEAIDLAASSPNTDPSCGGSATGTPATVSGTPDTPPALEGMSSPRWVAHTSEPPPVQARPPLVAGGFLSLQPARFMLGFGVGAAWLQEQAAAQHHIGNSGFASSFTGALVICDIFTISASGGFAFPADNASFSEEVVPQQGGGDPMTASSSFTLEHYSIAVGLRTPFWALFPTEKGWFAGSLFADYGSAGFHGVRSITDCVDCGRNDFDLPGGTFWRVGLDLIFPSSSTRRNYGFSLAYQRYEAGAGLTQQILIGLNAWMH